MTNKLTEAVKNYWPVVTSFLVIGGMFSTAVTYYARVEAETLIEVKMAAPIDKLTKNAEEVNRSINELKLDSQKNQLGRENLRDKIENVDEKLNLIIQMMRKNQ